MWKRNEYGDDGCFAFSAIFMVILFFACALIGGCLPEAEAGWGPRGSGPVGPPFVYSQPTLTSDWRYDNWPETAELYQGGVYAGRYDYATGIFQSAGGVLSRPTGWPVFSHLAKAKAAANGQTAKKAPAVCQCSDGCECGSKCQCAKIGTPCTPACKCATVASRVPDIPNYGVFSDLITQKPGGMYRLGDWRGTKEITRAEAIADVIGKVSDDTNKYRIVIVGGTPQQRNRVLDDLRDHASLSWLKENVLLQAYPDPKHYHLDGFKLDQDERFAKSGFMVALLAPPNKDGFGKRLYCRYDYAGGAEHFGAESRKKVDPKFDPNKDKDGGADIDVVGLLSKLPGWAYLVVGGAIALLILLRK